MKLEIESVEPSIAELEETVKASQDHVVSLVGDANFGLWAQILQIHPCKIAL